MNGNFSVQELDYLASGLNEINRLNGQLQQTYAQIDASGRQIRQLEGTMNSASARIAGMKARDASQRIKGVFRIAIPLAIIGYLYHRFNIAIQTTTTATSLSNFLLAAAFILSILIAIIYGIIRLIIGSARRTKDVRAKRAVRENPAQIIAEQNRYQSLNNQIAPLDAKIKQVWKSIQPLYDSFPPDYRYVEAVSSCANYMRNQRARTVGEALNLYEQDLRHNALMAQQQRQTALLTANLMANVVTAYRTGQMVDRMDTMNNQLGAMNNQLDAIQYNTANTLNRVNNMDPTVNVYVKR